MDIHISSKKFELTPAIKNHTTSLLEQLHKFNVRISSVNFIFDKEKDSGKDLFLAEAVCFFPYRK